MRKKNQSSNQKMIEMIHYYFLGSTFLSYSAKLEMTMRYPIMTMNKLVKYTHCLYKKGILPAPIIPHILIPGK
jgi:hypothetical protein